jgi:hypothetical protein
VLLDRIAYVILEVRFSAGEITPTFVIPMVTLPMLSQIIHRFRLHLPSTKFCAQLAISLLVTAHGILPASADSSATAPAALKTILTNIDTAANNRQLPTLLRYYSPNFNPGDGLTRATWQQSLGQFWQSYSNLKYTTTVASWKPDGKGYIAQTVTKITGTQQTNGRSQNLQATIESRQKIAGGQIVEQQIIHERTQVSSGSQPPTVDLTLPDKLQANAEYNLDAIVREPLGEDVLMGAVVEQPISADAYGKASDYKLELLTAGGLFKIARAPGKSGDYWFSTVFIRPTGMTTLTQRVRVIKAQ